MKTALITGGSRGIGLGIATALARSGYNLCINGMREQTDVQSQIDSLKSLGVDVIYGKGNIGEPADRSAIIQTFLDHYPAFHLLVNNAGVAPRVRTDLLDLEESNFDWLVDINLKGTFFLTQEIAKHMISYKQKESNYQPCIISVTSVSATVASVNRGEYCISKAGLAMMTKLFAARLAEYNIPVYEVRPGIIRTDMTSGVIEKYDKLIEAGLTIEKRWGTPEDIGSIVNALATGQIPYATGQVIHADGGLHIQRL